MTRQTAGLQRRKYDRKDVYRFICDYKADHGGESPRLRHIMEAFDIPSSATASYIISTLQNEGLLRHEVDKAGSFSVPGSDWLPPLSAYDRLGNAAEPGSIFAERQLGIFIIKFSVFGTLPLLVLQAMLGRFVIIRTTPALGRGGLQYTAYSDLFAPLKKDDDIPFYALHVTQQRNEVWVSRVNQHD